MDRESEEQEKITRSGKSQIEENGAESDEENGVDSGSLMRKFNEVKREHALVDDKLEEFRRLYEMNNNNGLSISQMIPEAHRPPSCNSNAVTNSSAIPNFSQHFNGDREKMLQYQLGYLGSLPQSFAGNLSANFGLQAGPSFPSLPPSRIPSPHAQYQRKQSSPQFNRSSPNFPSPPPAHMKRSASVSSRQSRDSTSPPVHQSSSWSFEEQFKQLYDIDRDDLKRKEFLDELFSFMQKHDTPVTRLPIMAKSVLDLYELYRLVVHRGGLVDVINKKLWQEVIKGLNLPSSITSAAFTLRTQYMKFLYAFECHKMNLSTRQELEAAIEGNKREGRRTSYYGDIGQIRSPNSGGPNNGPGNSLHHGQSQLSPVGLVSSSAQNAAVNSRLQMNGHSNQFGGHAGDASIPNVPGLSSLVLQSAASVNMAQDPRFIEYFKLINNRFMNNTATNGTGSSPDMPEASNLANIDVTSLAFWNLYNGTIKQTNVLPFPTQPQRGQSQSPNNEVPLDLGKYRKDEPQHVNSIESRAPKREACDNEVDENDCDELESDSDEEADITVPSISSQSSQNADARPVVVKMKINGIKYIGVVTPQIKK